MDQKTLDRLRPRDGSTGAIRAALDVAAAEAVDAERRRHAAGENRRRALTDVGSTAKDLAMIEGHAAAAALDIERLGLIRADLDAQLAEAVAAETAAAQRAEIEAARLAFVTAVDAAREALQGYLEHAAAILRACELELAKDAALARLRSAIAIATPVGASYRGPAALGVADVEIGLAGRVVLPGLPGQPMIWGTLPPPPPAKPVWEYG